MLYPVGKVFYLASWEKFDQNWAYNYLWLLSNFGLIGKFTIQWAYMYIDFSWHVAIVSWNMENIVNQQRKTQWLHEHSTSIICTIIYIFTLCYVFLLYFVSCLIWLFRDMWTTSTTSNAYIVLTFICIIWYYMWFCNNVAHLNICTSLE